MSKLSIVIPVYYNEENLWPLYNDLKEKVFARLTDDYELVMVDDGSGDRSYEIMKELAVKDSHIRIYHLSRNFGSHAASLCGLSHCTGDCAVTKSADLQEPSELILEMYEKWKQGANVVLAVREDREEKASQTLFSNLYYWLVRKFALQEMPKGGFDNVLIDRKVIEVLKSLDETNSALTGQILWSGFKTTTVYYTRKAREIGKSRWTLKKKIKLVMDTLYSFSSVPITIVSMIGAISFFGSLAWGLVVLVGKMSGAISVAGWTSLFIFQLFSFGVIMLTLGVLGGYLWRTFDASRNRPVYIVEESSEEESRD